MLNQKNVARVLFSIAFFAYSPFAVGQNQEQTLSGEGSQSSVEISPDLSNVSIPTDPNQETVLTDEGEVEEFSVDKVYTIMPGDTLWDICLLLLDDPYYWPKLWSLNQYIKNPHLIFPGDQLVFTPGTETSFPNLEIITEEPEPSTFEVVQGTKKEKEEQEIYKPIEDPFGDTVVEKNIARNVGVSIRLDNKFILAPEGVRTLGKVTHSGEPKMNLVFGDRIYVDFFRSDYKEDVQVGTKYFVIERVEKVNNPGGRGRIGTLIKKKGVVQVTDIRKSPRNKKKMVFEGTVLDVDDSIQRGDELIAYMPETKSLVPFYTDDLIKGQIAAADKQQMMISNNDYVFLNIGSNAGLEEGLQLYVVRRGDGLDFDISSNKHLPDVPIARVMITETWDTTATGYVVTLDQALEIGDRVTSVIE